MIFIFLFLGCDFFNCCVLSWLLMDASGSSNVSPLIMISLACQDVSRNQTYPSIYPSIHPSVYTHKHVERERQGGRERDRVYYAFHANQFVLRSFPLYL